MEDRYSQLLGRPFKWLETDCYILLKDFYKDVYQIELLDPLHCEDWDPQKHGNLLIDNFEKAGFTLLEINIRDLQFGDVILMSIQNAKANHCGIYIGNGEMIHHCYEHLSSKATYGGGWRRSTVALLRHKDVTPLDTEVKSVDVIDLLPSTHRKKFKDAFDKIDENEAARKVEEFFSGESGNSN